MEHLEHLELLKQGTERWNQWRTSHPLTRPNLSGVGLSGMTLREAHLSGAILTAAVLDDADLGRAMLREANLNGAALRAANLSGAILRDASLFQANLRGASFGGADLRDANLFQASLRGADLGRADARRANLRGADLTGASLTEVNLSGADLSGASLVNADLSGAALSGVDLSGAELDGADLSRATVGWTRFGDADLSVVKGLETVSHLGPSTTGLDTIYRSRGNIPEIFLRGAGVPAIFLTFMASLVGQPIEFFACFISSSGQDKRFCDRLHADLQAKGVRTWYLQEEARVEGAAWREVDASLKVYDKLVVVCSESSLQSRSVLRELEQALRREDERGQRVVFPVPIDDYVFDGWRHERKADLLSKIVGDFRGWDRSAEKYDDALVELVEALKGR